MKATQSIFFIVALLSATFPVIAQAAAPALDVSVASTVLDSIKAVANSAIMPMALTWLGALMSLQFMITNFGLLKSGADIEAVALKVAFSLVWFGVCVYILKNGPQLIDSIGTNALTQFASSVPSFGAVLTSTLVICSSLLAGIAALSAPLIGFPGLANVLVGILFAIFGAGMYLATKIFMLQIELGLIVMLSPLSFSFLGLDALRDQGIAPFKSILSLVYRIVVIGVIAAAFGQVTDVMTANLDKYSWATPSDWGNKINAIFSALAAYPVLCYLLWKSDSIASSLSSGTTNMAPSDIAGAVAAGVAGGMAVGEASKAAKTGVTSMSNFMNNMMGPGKMSNAGATGSGGAPGAAIPDPSGLPSLSDGPSAMSLDDVRKAERADKAQSVGGGSAQGGGAGAAGSAEGVGGAGGAGVGGSVSGGSSGAASGVRTGSAAFSQADGAKAAAAVSGGQNARNAAAVGAAMRASGAPETMAALAENIVADGGSAQGVANACGTTPAQNAAVAAAFAGAADPAWLESGSAANPQRGLEANAGIGDGGKKETSPSMANFSKHLSNMHHHGKEDKASVQVSINANAS